MGVEGTAAQDHLIGVHAVLLALPFVLHTGCLGSAGGGISIHDDLGHEGAGADVEVLAIADGER